MTWPPHSLQIEELPRAPFPRQKRNSYAAERVARNLKNQIRTARLIVGGSIAAVTRRSATLHEAMLPSSARIPMDCERPKSRTRSSAEVYTTDGMASRPGVAKFTVELITTRTGSPALTKGGSGCVGRMTSRRGGHLLSAFFRIPMDGGSIGRVRVATAGAREVKTARLA